MWVQMLLKLDVQLEIDTLRTVDDNRQGWLLKPLRRSWTEEQEKAAKANNCPLSELMNPYRSSWSVVPYRVPNGTCFTSLGLIGTG